MVVHDHEAAISAIIELFTRAEPEYRGKGLPAFTARPGSGDCENWTTVAPAGAVNVY